MTKKKSKIKKVRVVKAPTPDKQHRPSTKPLRELLETLITADEGQSVATLISIIHWYNKAMDWVLYKMEGHPSAQQNQDRSQFRTWWAKGAASERNTDKIEHYGMAIQFAERVLKSVKLKVPTIQMVLDAREAQQQRLVDYEERLKQKWDYILTMLQDALRPVNIYNKPIRLKVGKIKDPMIMDPELSTLSFRKDQVKSMNELMRREGIWSVALEVCEPLSRMAAFTDVHSVIPRNEPKKRSVIYADQVKALFTLWQNFKRWAQQPGAPKRLIKQYVPKEKVKRVFTGPKNGFHGKREMVLGQYIKSSSMGKVAEALMDGEFHSEEDLQKLIYPVRIQTRLPHIAKHGRENGHWELERVGGEVRMILTKEA